MSGNANTDVRNTRLLSLAGYERVMGGEGMEGGPCLAISTAALKCCSAQLLAGHLLGSNLCCAAVRFAWPRLWARWRPGHTDRNYGGGDARRWTWVGISSCGRPGVSVRPLDPHICSAHQMMKMIRVIGLLGMRSVGGATRCVWLASESRPPRCCLHPPSLPPSPLLIRTSYTPMQQPFFWVRFGHQFLSNTYYHVVTPGQRIGVGDI